MSGTKGRSRKKHQKGSAVLLILLMLIFGGTAIFSGWKIVSQLVNDREGKNAYSDVAENVVKEKKEVAVPVIETLPEEPDDPASAAAGTDTPTVPAAGSGTTVKIQDIDFEKLQAENSDVIAWLELDGTVINYPVVQAEDNDYYLRRLLDGSHHRFGTLFVDYRNDPYFQDRNTIIYGHHIKAGDMFFTLEKYKKQSFYAEHPYLMLYLPDETYMIWVFGAVVSAPENAPKLQFDSDEEFDRYLEKIRDRSLINGNVKVSAEDRIVTLYTCDESFDDARLYVYGVLKKVEQEP